MIEHYKMFIGGNWIDSESKEKIKIINPAEGKIFADVPKASKKDVKDAVNIADEIFSEWAELSPFERGKYLRKASRIVRSKAKEIAELMTKEQGKPLKEAEGEVIKGANILRYYAEEGERVYGRIISNKKKIRKAKLFISL
ncbi:MAG: aldehyde dehydrogenase family protein [Halanaerobiales bacterium]